MHYFQLQQSFNEATNIFAGSSGRTLQDGFEVYPIVIYSTNFIISAVDTGALTDTCLNALLIHAKRPAAKFIHNNKDVKLLHIC